ncbi:carboxymethylenebutenolidase [Pilimelia anulata]|uniref:Carboxymethylenebutenolidase n=1 Tax=Pilimelia anulata TaxID=53371 RepID=A0A8J3B727_9ACTN|nr:dienelactone hydrolase family protein [Pilimelia anulata]GGJ78586.1 carboxymethylenebutenolidase [Pilimelia anulata]
MDHINRYLTEEVVENYADGLIPRREALRQLGLLGMTAAIAAPLLAACDTDRADTPAPTPSGGTPAGPAPLPTESIRYPGAAGRTVLGAYAAAPSPRGAVLVVHENRGLTDHVRSVAGRLAAAGYAALAVDLLSPEGGRGAFADDAAATAALNAAPPARFVADMRSSLDELARRHAATRLGAVGFCFGGGMVWSLLAAGEPRLRAAAPFYGPLPDGAAFAGSRNAAVLAVYAERDARVNASRAAAAAALQRAGLVHEVLTFPGADHAFFNDTGARYDAAAAATAWTRLTGWFDTHLAAGPSTPGTAGTPGTPGTTPTG